MGLKQYQVGKSWEEEVMEYYKTYGFCTIKLPTDIDGTVCDIIALKYNKAVHPRNSKIRTRLGNVFRCQQRNCTFHR